MNYFELYELPVSLSVDANNIKKKFYALSRQYHPDFFANAPGAEQAEALEKSSMVNKAFKTFSSKDETIKYVLQLKELLQEEEKYELDPVFLMEVMELNEALMELEMEDNNTQLASCEQQANQLLQQLYNNVATVIEHYKEGITTQKELLQVKDYYYKKKYLQRILDRIVGMRNIASRI